MFCDKCLFFVFVCEKDSGRFATSTAPTQGIGQRECTWPNQSRLGSKLDLRRTRGSWHQLGLNLSPTGVEHGATWARLDASWAYCNMRNVVLRWCGGRGIACNRQICIASKRAICIAYTAIMESWSSYVIIIISSIIINIITITFTSFPCSSSSPSSSNHHHHHFHVFPSSSSTSLTSTTETCLFWNEDSQGFTIRLTKQPLLLVKFLLCLAPSLFCSAVLLLLRLALHFFACHLSRGLALCVYALVWYSVAYA